MVSPSELVRLVKPGPRYTSYPPATEMSPAFDAEHARSALAELSGTPASRLSLYCHVPFCTSLCWYCGCNVQVSRDRDRGTAYVDTLIHELGLVADALGDARALTEVALGGGSPSFLYPRDLARLVGAIFGRFELTDDHELGIELDPRDASDEQLHALVHLGFSRISLGVQDFAPDVQQAIHRIQSVAQTRHLIETARRLGISTVNIDLVYGLPRQTPDSFATTLREVFALRPDRVALFGYAHLPHLRPHQRLVERSGPLPDASERAALFCAAVSAFEQAGYQRVGMDHFALPDDALARAARDGQLARNFQGYVVRRATAIVGTGVTGISSTERGVWQGHANLDTWREAVERGELPVARGVALDADDRLRGFVIERLMCDGELAFADVEARFSARFEAYFDRELEELASPALAPLVQVDRVARRIDTTATGRDLIRNVCMVFDRYLRRPRPSADAPPRFSPTI